MDDREGLNQVGELIHRLAVLDEQSLVLHVYGPKRRANPGEWRVYRQLLSGHLQEGRGATLAEALRNLLHSAGTSP